MNDPWEWNRDDTGWPKEPGPYMICGGCNYTRRGVGLERKPNGKYIELYERPLYCDRCGHIGIRNKFTTFFIIPKEK